MAQKVTPAYITTISPDHTIVLPAEMPIGATVAVVLISTSVSEADDMARRARFAETLSAIHAASASETQPAAIADEDLDALIDRARKSG